MSVAYMREELKNAPKYKRAQTWLEKVDKMHDNQVMAVYFRMKRSGEL